jgi:hypothetical protein
VPDYISAPKTSTSKPSTTSETTSKKAPSAPSKDASNQLPGASKKVQKGGGKIDKGNSNKVQAASKSEKTAASREPKKLSQSGKRALDDGNRVTSGFIDLLTEDEDIMGEFDKANDRVLGENAARRANTKEATTLNKFTPINKSASASSQNNFIKAAETPSTGQNNLITAAETSSAEDSESESSLPLPMKKKRPISLRGIKGGPADKPPRSVFKAVMEAGPEANDDDKEDDMDVSETLIVESPSNSSQREIVATANEDELHPRLFAPPASTRTATLDIADSRHGTGLPPHDIYENMYADKKVIPQRVMTPAFNKSSNSKEYSMQSFNTSQERRDAGVALQGRPSVIQASFLARVEDNTPAFNKSSNSKPMQPFNVSQERRHSRAALQGHLRFIEANLLERAEGNDSVVIQLRTPPSPREGSTVSEASTEVGDPEDTLRAITQHVPRTPNTVSLSSPNVDSEKSQNMVSMATPFNQTLSNARTATGLGINVPLPETPTIKTSIEYTPNTARGSAYFSSGSPLLRDYQSESPTPSAPRGRGIAGGGQRGSSFSTVARRRTPEYISVPHPKPGLKRKASADKEEEQPPRKFSTPNHKEPQKRKLPVFSNEEEQPSREINAPNPKQSQKGKASALSDEGEEPSRKPNAPNLKQSQKPKLSEQSSRKVSLSSAKREAEDIQRRMTEAEVRLAAARAKSSSLDEEEKLAFKVKEIEEAAARLERENATREVCRTICSII